MTHHLRKRILNELNTFRNRLASGLTIQERTGKKYPSAIRMREIIWSNELSYLAHVAMKGCAVISTLCTRTKHFPKNHVFSFAMEAMYPFYNDSNNFWLRLNMNFKSYIEEYELAEKLELQNE